MWGSRDPHDNRRGLGDPDARVGRGNPWPPDARGGILIPASGVLGSLTSDEPRLSQRLFIHIHGQPEAAGYQKIKTLHKLVKSQMPLSQTKHQNAHGAHGAHPKHSSRPRGLPLINQKQCTQPPCQENRLSLAGMQPGDPNQSIPGKPLGP